MRRLTLACCSLLIAALLATTAAGCGAAPRDDFSELALNAGDPKSDAFAIHMKLAGSLDYGQTSKAEKYVFPRYVAWKFAGQPGDRIEATVTSTDGTPVVFIVDSSFHLLDRQDATSSSVVSRVKLGANSNPDVHAYYVIVRDAHLADAHFQVALAQQPDLTYACDVDSDCVVVPLAVCCPHGAKVAVRAGHEQAYRDDNQCAQPPQFCSFIFTVDNRVPVCRANVCAMIDPPAACGGIAALGCPAGQYCKLDTSACDPAHGGADCGGTCAACVQNVACTLSSHFDRAQCACVPDAGCKTDADCGAGGQCQFCSGTTAQCVPAHAAC